MITVAKSRVFLALGGNLGEPRKAFIIACSELQQHPRIELLAASALYLTPPIGGPTGQPDYLNAVVELTTDLHPLELLAFCRQIEDAAGRTREVQWGARTLDLDLLFFGQSILETQALSLPHPRLQERHFVLLPLAELAADFIHPRLECTVASLLEDLPEPVGITRLEEEWLAND